MNIFHRCESEVLETTPFKQVPNTSSNEFLSLLLLKTSFTVSSG